MTAEWNVEAMRNVAQLKNKLRKDLLSRRAALSPEDRSFFSEQAQRRVLESAIWKQARTVALYCSARGELKTDRLLQHAWQEGKSVLLPRCLPPAAGEGMMVMARCYGWDDLEPGYFGIPEPKKSCPVVPREAVLSELPDLIVVPAVGIGRRGERIGYGRGFYDRLLALPGWKNAVRIAMVFSCQIDAIPISEEDVLLHGYVTEKEAVWLCLSPSPFRV
ncbi:MAG: 5-formyltetrahydrofolate cyclo-ligase [Desulfovibrionaceae bacterium]|nr:5-formyltetrahydrofolate cyclo-ligase [Desulfovibrionaceae bacterium]